MEKAENITPFSIYVNNTSTTMNWWSIFFVAFLKCCIIWHFHRSSLTVMSLSTINGTNWSLATSCSSATPNVASRSDESAPAVPDWRRLEAPPPAVLPEEGPPSPAAPRQGCVHSLLQRLWHVPRQTDWEEELGIFCFLCCFCFFRQICSLLGHMLLEDSSVTTLLGSALGLFYY